MAGTTIFALATAQGRAGVSVFRISGPDAFEAVARLTGPLPPLRMMQLRVLKRPNDGLVIDEALIVRFPADGSFTGENTVEIQGHGSPAVHKLLLEVLLSDCGLQLAEPGEFTRRALQNGRMSLPEVEGLADLIEAETVLQQRQAMQVMQGSLGDLVAGWRVDLVRAAALLAAVIDFSDEELPAGLVREVEGLMAGVGSDLRDQLAGAQGAERVRNGFRVAILGVPNAGKSTLLNWISGRPVALTSEVAGTTRDVIEVQCDIDGLPVTFLDTAGLRETDDPVEKMGVERAASRATEADLRIFLLGEDGLSEVFVGLRKDGDLFVQGKADLGPTSDEGVSGLTGVGVPELLKKVQQVLMGRLMPDTVTIRQRHVVAMQRALEALDRLPGLLSEDGLLVDLAAEELRIAILALDSLIGKVDVEDLLDEVFQSFCFGK